MATDVEVFDVPQRRLCFATLTRRQPKPPFFVHTFGGRPKHEGIIPPGCTRPLVLFYAFDVADPLLGMPADPGFSRLPLYAPIFTEADGYGMQIAYRVVSDTAIETLSKKTRDFEYGPSDFPERLPRRFVKLEDSYIPPDEPETALRYSGVFGWDTLTRAQLEEIRPHLEESCEDEFDFSDGGSMAEIPIEDLFDAHGDSPFLQGAPGFGCPNRRCRQAKSKAPIPLLLLLRDDDLGAGIDMGGHFNSHSRLMWLKCPVCHAIVVTTEGT